MAGKPQYLWDRSLFIDTLSSYLGYARCCGRRYCLYNIHMLFFYLRMSFPTHASENPDDKILIQAFQIHYSQFNSQRPPPIFYIIEQPVPICHTSVPPPSKTPPQPQPQIQLEIHLQEQTHKPNHPSLPHHYAHPHSMTIPNRRCRYKSWCLSIAI